MGYLHEKVPRSRRRYVPEELSRCSKVYSFLVMDGIPKWGVALSNIRIAAGASPAP